MATKFFSGKSWDFTMFFLETKHQTSGVFNVWVTQIFQLILIDAIWKLWTPNSCNTERGVSLYQQLFGIWSLCDPTSFRVGERWPSVATADCGVVFVAEMAGSEWETFDAASSIFSFFPRVQGHLRFHSVSFCWKRYGPKATAVHS